MESGGVAEVLLRRGEECGYLFVLYLGQLGSRHGLFCYIWFCIWIYETEVSMYLVSIYTPFLDHYVASGTYKVSLALRA